MTKTGFGKIASMIGIAGVTGFVTYFNIDTHEKLKS